MALREILASFGVEVDDKDLKTLDKSLGGVSENIKKMGKLLLGGLAGKAIVGFITDSAAMGAQIQDLSDKFNIGTDDLQKFQYVVEQSGGSTETANAAMGKFAKTISEAATGGAAQSQAFAALGVSVTDAAGNTREMGAILPEVADKIADMSDPAQQAQAAIGLFGKAGLELLPTLKNGADGLAEFGQEFDELGLGLGKDFIDKAGAADDEIAKFGRQFKVVKSIIAAEVLPVVTEMLKHVMRVVGGFIKLSKQTKIVHHGMMLLGGLALLRVMKNLKSVVGPAMSAVKAFRSLSTSIFGASVPIWALILAAGIIYLALDDLFAMLRGDKSVIGDFLDEFGGAGTAAELSKTLKDVWDQVSQAFEDARPALEAVWASIKEAIGDFLPTAVEWFVKLVKVVAALGTALLGAAGSMAKLLKGDFSGAVDIAKTTGEAIFGKTKSYYDQDSGQTVTRDVGGLFGATNKELATELPGLAARGAFGTAMQQPGMPGSKQFGPPAPPNMNTEVKTTITVNESKNAKDTADEIAKKQAQVAADTNKQALASVANYGG